MDKELVRRALKHPYLVAIPSYFCGSFAELFVIAHQRHAASRSRRSVLTGKRSLCARVLGSLRVAKNTNDDMVDPLFPLPYLTPDTRITDESGLREHWCRRRSGRRDYG